jgi:hypothetical protein
MNLVPGAEGSLAALKCDKKTLDDRLESRSQVGIGANASHDASAAPRICPRERICASELSGIVCGPRNGLPAVHLHTRNFDRHDEGHPWGEKFSSSSN